MAYDEGLAQRIREALDELTGTVEKKMFGGVCYLVGGNMACGVFKEFLIVRVGPDRYDKFLKLPGARVFDITGKVMKGWVMVEESAYAEDEDLREWIVRGLEFAQSLPPEIIGWLSMIIHVDMDAFFASVEQLDNPELLGKPVIVGGTSNRGVVAASSYEARKFGVYSAMPIFQAKQKCPQGIFIRPSKHRYKEVSILVMSILSTFTPVMEQVSIDEAFLDITGCESIFGTPYEIGVKIKQQIKKEAGLACSVGIAPLKFLAKIASDMDKPDGLTYISPEKVTDFIKTLPVRKISGVGKQTAGHLERMGIVTLGDVNNYTREKIVGRFGKYGNRLFELANGIDRSIVHVHRSVKSISTEETLAADITDKDQLKKYLLKHSEDVGCQLRKKGRKARTITLKVKHSDFKQITRQTKLAGYTFSSEKIYQAAVSLLEEYTLRKPVRLIGVGASGLDDKKQAVQMDLFSNSDNGMKKWEKVDTAVDAITEKFGKDVIKKAELTGDE